MKGIILAGGRGSRLHPLTKNVSKQLLPVYDRQMIFYPLNTLIKAGIKEILIIVSPENSGAYLNLIGSLFNKDGISISFIVQEKPNGLPEAFILGEHFIGKDNVALILGDNIFEYDFSKEINSFKKGAHIFCSPVHDPSRYGVVELDISGKIVSIEEKPKFPKSNLAVVGMYLFDNDVIKISKQLNPSERNELEITDIQKYYLNSKKLKMTEISGGYYDAGTSGSLLDAAIYVRNNIEKFSSKTIENVIFGQKKKITEISYGVIPITQIDDKKYLLLIRNKDTFFWSFPKGMPNEGESPVETAKREFYEETGVECQKIYKDFPFKEQYNYLNGDTIVEKSVVYFIGLFNGKSFKPQEEEVEECKLIEITNSTSILTKEKDEMMKKVLAFLDKKEYVV